MKANNDAMPSCRMLQFKRRAPYLMLAYGAATLGALGALPVYAQVAPVANTVDASASDTVETVVVTARKVKEQLQDVPLAISAFGSQTLENAGVRSLQDLSNLTPGMTLSSVGTSSAVPTIRGQASISQTSDANVAIFLDGIYLANSSAVSLGLIDLERVEVVKGPVSALYGRNAFAGAINYVSKKPPAALAGDIQVTLGNAGMKNTTMSVGGSVVPGLLRVRAALGYEEYDGTHRDAVNGLRTGGDKQQDGQVAFELTPNDKLTVSGALYRGVDNFGNPATVYMDNNCGPKSGGAFTQYCGQLNTSQHGLQVVPVAASAGAVGNQRYVTSSNLKFAYDLGWSDVSALLGYNKVDQQRLADFNGRRDGLPFPLVGGGTVTLPVLFGSFNDNKDKSVELRLSSKQNQALRWSTGFYYFDADRYSGNLASVDAATLPAGKTVAYLANFAKYQSADGSFNPASITPAIGTDRIHSEFVGSEYDLLSNLTASVEGRHTAQSKTQLVQVYSASANAFVQSGAKQNADFSFNNYRATLNWKPYTGAMYYASAANGIKAGGFNSAATIASEVAFNPEKNTTLELGSKNTFLAGKLQLNAAIFHIKASNLQVAGPSDDAANAALVTKNFGAATTKGLELELVAKPMRGWTVNAGLGYVDPKFDKGTYDFSASFIATCRLLPACAGRVVTVQAAQGARTAVDISGYTPPKASKLNLTLGTEVHRRVNEEWSWFGRVDGNYRSKQYSSQQNLNYWGSQTNVNLRSGFESTNYRVAFFVKNLTNNQVPGLATQNTRLNDLVTEMVAYLPEGRTFGVTASYKF